MTWDRIQRQEAILLEKIAVLVQRLNDPRLGFVTITAAKLSRDKRYCTVQFTVMGSESEVSKTTRALAAAAPRVREMLAPSLQSRVLPELRFVMDENVVKESRLRTLIEEVTAERVDRAGPDELMDVDTDTDTDTAAEAEAEAEAEAAADVEAGADELGVDSEPDAVEAPKDADPGLDGSS